MVCPHIIPEEELITVEGFVATIQGDTVITDQVYVVNAQQIEITMAYYSKAEVIDIKFKVSVEEEGTDTEVFYPDEGWEEVERNKPWVLIFEPITEGKYSIIYKVGEEEKTIEFWVRHQHYDFACKICGRDLKVTLDRLKNIFPSNNALNENHVTHFQNALKTGKFYTCHRQAHFFSQVKVESDNMTELKESSYYQLHAALTLHGGKSSTKDWYKQSFYDDKDYLDYFHYKVYEKTTDSTESYTAKNYQTYKWKSSSTSDTVRVPTLHSLEKGYFKKLNYSSTEREEKAKKLFSAIYANKYGNGAPSTEDGYKYRGQGAIQLTWKDNYKAVSSKCNTLFGTSYNWEINPSEVSTDLKAAIYSAVAYFHFRLKDDLKLLDGTDLNAVSKAVNGGTNGLSHRQSAFNTLIKSTLFNNCKPKSPKDE